MNGEHIAILIPTCARYEPLRTCLLALAAQLTEKIEDTSVKVFASDDAWTASLAKQLEQEFPWIMYLSGPKRGPAANRNFLAQHVQSSWLAFLDDDVIPDAQWYDGFREGCKSYPQCHVFEGRVYAPGQKPDLAHESPVNEQGGYLWSNNLFIRKALFDQLGGFDERFPYPAMEDVEFRLRLQMQDIPFQFLPRASVQHPWRKRGNWKSLTHKRDSVMIYLALHAQERKKLSPAHYLWSALYGFSKHTLPSLLQGHWKGVGSALRLHASDVVLAARIFFYNKHSVR